MCSPRADGGPASDVLIADRVFVGFGSPTSTPEVRELLELRFVSHGTLVVVIRGVGVVGPGATPAAKTAVQGLAGKGIESHTCGRNRRCAPWYRVG